MGLLGDLGRRGLAGADRPDRLVGERPGPAGSRGERRRAAASSTAKVSPGLALVARLADADQGREAGARAPRPPCAATSSSLSPWSRRRSLWPQSTQEAAGVDELAPGDVAGVGALSASGWRSCPPTPMPLPASASTTAASSGKRRKDTTSGAARRRASAGAAAEPAAERVGLASAAGASSSCRRPAAGGAGAAVALIERPAVPRGRDAGQRLAGQELERGAAAGRDVADAARRRPAWWAAATVSPPPISVKPGQAASASGHGAGAGVERRLLEDAERAVPEQRPGAARSRRRRRRGVLGPMSSARKPAGTCVGARRSRMSRRRCRRRRRPRGRSAAAPRCPAPRRAPRILARQVEPVGLDQRGLEVVTAGRRGRCWPCRRRPSARRAAAGGSRGCRSCPRSWRRRGSPRTGARGSPSRRRERLDLAHQQAARRPCAAGAASDADDRGVRAVGAAEGVVDVGRGGRGEGARRTPGRSSPRRRGSAGSRAARRRRRRARPATAAPPARRRSPRRRRPGAPRSSASRVGRRRAACTSGLRSPFGRPQCETSRSSRAGGRQLADRRQRLLDPRVVGHLARPSSAR